MNRKYQHLQVNDRAGRLSVVDQGPMTRRQGRPLLCVCDCGNYRVYMSIYLTHKLIQGAKISCGCWVSEIRSRSASARKKTHGLRRTPEYSIWSNIKNRTTNPKCKEYSYYGGRGIKICDQWASSFEEFYRYTGSRPTPKHQIDRYPNNDGDYEPGNIRWATKSEQMLNRRKWGTCKNSRNAAQLKPESKPTTQTKGA